jgi:hypothetical protein
MVFSCTIMPDPIPDALLDLTEVLLNAQLKAIRTLRQSPPGSLSSGRPTTSDGTSPRRRGAPRSGTSQLDTVYNLLKSAAKPLHISEIVAQATAAGVPLDRDSVVSALSKRIAHADRFRRTAPNTFALLTAEVLKP